jgi:hypothetical protein
MPHAHTDCPFQEIAASPGVHALQVYERETHLVDAIARLVGCGLAGGDAVVVIATPAHRAALRDVLGARGVDGHAAERDGRYVEVDAQGLLAQLSVGGEPDRARFFDVVGGMLRALREGSLATGGGGGVRAFGEMVALLWEAGNRAGALALERFWNEIAVTMPLTLLCAYPAHGFADDPLGAALRDVCAQHPTVIPAGTDQGAIPSAALLAAVRGERWDEDAADWVTLSQGLSPDGRDRLLHAAGVIANALRNIPLRRP